MKLITKICLALYLAGGILAYGHWWNNTQFCSSNSPAPELKPVGAFVVGLLWPLYVSTILFEKR